MFQKINFNLFYLYIRLFLFIKKYFSFNFYTIYFWLEMCVVGEKKIRI